MGSLKKTLNLAQGTGILISTLLGSGIFIVPAIAATIAGVNSIISWLLMLIFILPIVITFGYLGASYPDAGGTAYFVQLAFGEKAAHFLSWLYISVIPIGPPVVIITGANYLGSLFNASEFQVYIISLVMLLAVLLINLSGLRLTGNIQLMISILVALILLLLVFLGLHNNTNLSGEYLSSLNQSTILQIGKALAIIFWCFVGIEAVAHLAAEFNNPQKDFPRAVIISVLVVGFLYLLTSLLVIKFKVYGTESLNSNTLVFLVNRLIGPYGKLFMGITGFLTCFAGVNVYILSNSRLMFSMGKNILPGFFSRTTKNGTPLTGLIFTIIMVTATVSIKFLRNINLASLISYANGVFILIYLAAAVSGVKLLSGRKKKVAIFAVLFCLVTLFAIGKMAVYGILILVFSLLWDFSFQRWVR